MNIFECSDLNIWKQLTDEQKREVFNPLLMYFVSPLLHIQNSHLVTFDLCGMKCRTFELEIDGEIFVFIPGQKETILGWDQGVEGLKSYELLGFKRFDLQGEVTYGTTISADELNQLAEISDMDSDEFDFSSLEDISKYINLYTSPLRKSEIPAMLVAKKAIPVGAKYKGSFNCVTGSYEGKQDFFEKYQVLIEKQLTPSLSFEESLEWEYPSNFLVAEQLFLKQVENTNSYDVFEHQTQTHNSLVKDLSLLNMELLTEDQWEYAVGGGTRRLFRWGNELVLEGEQNQLALKKAQQSNMFGLQVNTSKESFEVTSKSTVLKLGLVDDGNEQASVIQNNLPLSTYYRSHEMIAPTQKLDARLFSYRKVIVIEP